MRLIKYGLKLGHNKATCNNEKIAQIRTQLITHTHKYIDGLKLEMKLCDL